MKSYPYWVPYVSDRAQPNQGWIYSNELQAVGLARYINGKLSVLETVADALLLYNKGGVKLGVWDFIHEVLIPTHNLGMEERSALAEERAARRKKRQART